MSKTEPGVDIIQERQAEPSTWTVLGVPGTLEKWEDCSPS